MLYPCLSYDHIFLWPWITEKVKSYYLTRTLKCLCIFFVLSCWPAGHKEVYWEFQPCYDIVRRWFYWSFCPERRAYWYFCRQLSWVHSLSKPFTLRDRSLLYVFEDNWFLTTLSTDFFKHCVRDLTANPQFWAVNHNHRRHLWLSGQLKQEYCI